MARTAKTISISLMPEHYARLEALARERQVNGAFDSPATVARVILIEALARIEAAKSTESVGCVSCNPLWKDTPVVPMHLSEDHLSLAQRYAVTQEDLCKHYGCACACHLLKATVIEARALLTHPIEEERPTPDGDVPGCSVLPTRSDDDDK